MGKQTYLVTSTVLVEADGPKDAALKALAKVWQSPHSTYAVTDPDHLAHLIRLNPSEMRSALDTTGIDFGINVSARHDLAGHTEVK